MINGEDEEGFEKQKRDDYLKNVDDWDYYGQNPDADLDYWSKAAYWTVEEATALSFGQEPRIVNSASIPKPGLEYENRLDLARRAKKTEDLKEPNRPLDYINWAKQSGIPFLEELETLVRKRQGPDRKSQEPDRKTRPKAAESKEITSLLKMVFGMSITLYEYDVKKSHGIPTKIYNDLLLLNIPLDRDTISKWLTQAIDDFGDLLPPKHK
jgi:hypothetical protein